MNVIETFPAKLAFIYRAEGDKACLYASAFDLPLIQLSNHSTDIVRGDCYKWYYSLSFAYLAKLGWSPILRDLLGLKRRSERRIEKGEDGARAQMTEEYISLFAFKETRQFSAALTEELLDEVLTVVRSLEVSRARRREWSEAIELGAALFRALKNSDGALVVIDLVERRLDWTMLPPSKEVEVSTPEGTPRRFMRATGKYNLLLVETKPGVVEVFAALEYGGMINLGSKAEEWSLVESDGFRWHDLFHLSFLVIVGWSAVCKAMLGIPDEVAPRSGMMGIRGAILEEVIIARFFAEISQGKDHILAAKLTADRAVKMCLDTKLAEVKSETWREALLVGHALMQKAKETGGGKIHLNLGSKEIAFVD